MFKISFGQLIIEDYERILKFRKYKMNYTIAVEKN